MAEHFGVKRQLDINPQDEKDRGSNVQQTSPDYAGKPNPSGTLSSGSGSHGSHSSSGSSSGSQAGGISSGRSRTEGVPEHDRISQRAYQLWEERGREHGHELEDWLRAEREVSRA